MSGIARPFAYEEQTRRQHPAVSIIAGIDEAGRGPLAGPVVIAGCILYEGFELPVNDSKQLSERRREELAAAIKADPRIRYVIVQRSPQEIDRMNILRATQDAMRQAARELNPDWALIDGVGFADFPCPASFIVHGDALSASIAAASILAKTERDAIMCAYDSEYPGYGFASHKGYGTARHLAAIRQLGPCPIHRRSFAPVSQPLLPFEDN